MTTPKLGLDEIAESQSNKYATHNEALRGVDALLPKIAISVRHTPPGSPSNGDVYIISDGSPTATGDWAGQDGDIAWYNGEWNFVTPEEGWTLYVQGDDKDWRFDGTSWNVGGGGVAVQNDTGSPSVNGTFTTLVFDGGGFSVTDQGANTAFIEALAGNSGVTLEDEGSTVTGGPHTTLNFVGAGVSAADAGGGEATITIAGGGASSYSDTATASTLSANSKNIADTSSAAVAYTLPAGSNGDWVVVVDGANNAATNNITLTPQSGEKVEGVANDTAVIDVDGGSLELVYSTVDSRGWIVADSASATQGGPTTFNGAKLERTTNQTITTSSWTTVDFDTEVYDTNDFATLGGSPASSLIIPSAGYYHLTGFVTWEGATAQSRRIIRFVINGTNKAQVQLDAGTDVTDSQAGQITSGDFYLAAGDEVHLEVWQDSGGNLDLVSDASNKYASLSAHEIK